MNIIKESRLALNLQKKDLALLLHVTPSFIGRVENGKDYLPKQRVPLFAKVLNLKESELAQLVSPNGKNGRTYRCELCNQSKALNSGFCRKCESEIQVEEKKIQTKSKRKCKHCGEKLTTDRWRRCYGCDSKAEFMDWSDSYHVCLDSRLWQTPNL